MNSTPEPPFDLLILGGGSAGYAAAKEGQRLGLRTALVEGGREVGGLCILRGCTPSKTLLESANRRREVGRAGEFGVRVDGPVAFDAPAAVARKRRLVARFAGERRESIAKAGFAFLRGRARFVDPHTVELTPLENGGGPARRLEARAFVIATGSKVKMAPLDGLEETGFLTSDDLLECERAPASVIVLGAGPVGLEAAHYYRCLGSEVTVLNREEQILGGVDADVAGALEAALTARGVRFFCQAEVRSVERAEGGKRVRFEFQNKERSVTAEEIIHAVGREACVAALNLEVAGVKLSQSHHVAADPAQRTSQAHVFAAGDVCGPYEILHEAVRQGEIAARNAARALGRLKGEVETRDDRLRLLAIFTEPEVATLGLSEREARETQRAFRTARYEFKDHGRAVIEGTMEGFVKLLAEPGAGGRLLGAACVGPRAAELIHELVAVLYYHGTARDLLAMPHYHPTLSEIWTFPAGELAGGED